MRYVTVGSLLEELKNVDPKTPVVIADGPDHSYTTVELVKSKTAGFDGSTFYEWYGPENASPEEKPVNVIVLI